MSDLSGVAHAGDAGLVEDRVDDEDHQDQAEDLEADLGDPVEDGGEPVAVAPEGGPADHEGGGPGQRARQAGEAEEHVGEVADQDRQDRLREGEPEGADQDAVEEELDVPDGSRPEPEEAHRAHLPVGLRDQVDAALLQLERFVRLRGLERLGCRAHGLFTGATGAAVLITNVLSLRLKFLTRTVEPCQGARREQPQPPCPPCVRKCDATDGPPARGFGGDLEGARPVVRHPPSSLSPAPVAEASADGDGAPHRLPDGRRGAPPPPDCRR